MNPDREKQLLEKIARRDQRIALLEQKLDALVKRLFGSKSEVIDPASSNSCWIPMRQKTHDRRVHSPRTSG